MTFWFWLAFVSIIIGIGLSWYAAIRGLNSAFSEKVDHGLFWAGTVFLTIGIAIMLVLIFNYASENTKLMKEVRNLNNTIYELNKQLGQCGGKGVSGPSGPGFFSRLGSKIGGYFSRNTSVPIAGNPGEVNPFKNP